MLSTIVSSQSCNVWFAFSFYFSVTWIESNKSTDLSQCCVLHSAFYLHTYRTCNCGNGEGCEGCEGEQKSWSGTRNPFKDAFNALLVRLIAMSRSNVPNCCNDKENKA